MKKSHITIPYLNVKGLFLHKCVLIRQIMYSSAYYFDEFFSKDAILTKRRNIMKCIEIKDRSLVNNGFQFDWQLMTPLLPIVNVYVYPRQQNESIISGLLYMYQEVTRGYVVFHILHKCFHITYNNTISSWVFFSVWKSRSHFKFLSFYIEKKTPIYQWTTF